MVGQKRLLSIFNNFTIESIPKTIMLVGESGCGKHTFVDMLSTKFNLDVVNISDKLTYEKITDLYLSAIPHIYLVDSILSDQQQNSLLKFIEEPPKDSLIFILANSTEQFIPTIRGRCIIYKFDEYTDGELSEFTDNKEWLSYVRTPGKLIQLSNKNNSWVFQLNETILTKISDASIPNTLKLPEKFSYDGNGGVGIDLEMSLLLNLCISMFKRTNQFNYLYAYKTTDEYIKMFGIPNVDKKKLFSLYLFDLKKSLKRK